MRGMWKTPLALLLVVLCVGASMSACREQEAAPASEAVLEESADEPDEEPAEAAAEEAAETPSSDGTATPPRQPTRPPRSPVTQPDAPLSASARRARALARYPAFPWPPPRPSASAEISRALLRTSTGDPATLGDVDRRLSAALLAAGYESVQYFTVPDGFAVLTRIEHMEPDGRAGDPRWLTGSAPQRWQSVFSLQPLLRAIGLAPPGYYRVIALLVTPHPFTRTGDRLNASEMRVLFDAGLNRLPPALADRPYTDDIATTALVYEFERGPRERTRLNDPGLITGREHLERSGLLDALGP
jgi:hypothetical protein